MPVNGGPADHPLAQTPPDPSDGRANIYLRYVYEGGKITRDSKIVRLELSEDELLAIPGKKILSVPPRPPISWCELSAQCSCWTLL